MCLARRGGPAHLLAIVLCSLLLALPMHAGTALVVHLHAIRSGITLTRLEIFGDHRRQRNEAASVLRPALQDGKIQQREIVALDHFLARTGGDFLGEKLAHLGQHGQHLDFVEQPLRRLHVHEVLDPVGDLVERIHVQGQPHAAFGAELINQQLGSRIAFHVLEKQCRPAGTMLTTGPPFGDPIRDLGDLQHRIGFRLDALQFSRFVERGDPISQVVVGQANLVSVGRTEAA